ncbi:MAG: DinB family protein [Vicinamibacterales bacterium]
MSATKTQREEVDVCAVTTAIGGSSARAEALALRLEQGARALGAMASDMAQEEWTTRLPGDGRSVGVVVHHVASVYPIEIDLAQRIAKGQAIEGVTMADVDAMNARHAVEQADTTVADAVALLARNSGDAAAAIRALGDEALDRVAPASLYNGAPVSCQFMLEDHAVRHSYHHLAGIARALGRALPKFAAFLLAVVLLAGPTTAPRRKPRRWWTRFARPRATCGGRQRQSRPDGRRLRAVSAAPSPAPWASTTSTRLCCSTASSTPGGLRP